VVKFEIESRLCEAQCSDGNLLFPNECKEIWKVVRRPHRITILNVYIFLHGALGLSSAAYGTLDVASRKMMETKMSDFNARAKIYRVEFNSAARDRTIPKPIRSGTVAESDKWIMAKRPDDRKTYFMTVPLEAGFIKSELDHREIEAISQRPDFPE
jgi:hypothetical protein